jgi:hypothetical protein
MRHIQEDKRVKFAVSLLILVIAGILLTYAARNVQHIRPANNGVPELHTQDILIHDRHNIWLLNSSDLSLTLLVDLSEKGFLIGGDVHVSPQHDYIYMLAQELEDANEHYRLIRYRLANDSIQTVFETQESPGLSRMSPISPDEKRTFLFFGEGLDRSTADMAYSCLLDIEAGNCMPVDINIIITELFWFWLSKDNLAGVHYNSVYFLSIEHENITISDLSKSSEYSIYRAAYRNSEPSLILTAYRQLPDAQEPLLLSLNLDSYEFSELPWRPTNYGAAFSSLSVAPNGRYAAYKQGLYLEVLDLETGEIGIKQNDVLDFAWLANSEQLVVFTDLPLPSEDNLSVVNVGSNQNRSIWSPDHQVYIVTVP